MSFHRKVNSWSLLSEEQIEQIHKKSLQLLEDPGVRLASQKAQEILSSHGAKVNNDITQIPPELIEDNLGKAPESFTLYGRNPENNLELDRDRTYLSVDGCSSKTVDFSSGKRRASTKEDIENVSKIADYLDLIDIVSPIVSAQDTPQQARAMHELEAGLTNTEKHVLTESVSTAEEAEQEISIAAAIAGGRDKLREKPIFSNFVCTISPLAHDKGGIDAALTFAEAGVPVGVYSMATAAVSSPITLAGTLAVINAEVISALALLELAHPGAKVFYSGGPATIDLNTGGYVGCSPEAHLLRAGVGQLASHYGIPSHVGAGATSAKRTGLQHGTENTLSYLLPTLNDADVLFGFGLLDGSNLFRYENLVLDHEIAYNIKEILEGITVDEEDFALDLIRDLGPGGVYLNQTHTVENMREALSNPYLSDRQSFEAWEESGEESTEEKARRKVEEILAEHEVTPVPEDVRDKLDSLLAEAECG